jgi:uncharacterized membrane protein
MQMAGWASLFVLFTCFLILVALESRMPSRAWAAKAALLACVVLHVGIVLYLRRKRCPACGHRFVAATKSVLGSFTTLSQRGCQHCGAGSA